jgi:serine/threonine protein phosphatase PrpC
MSNNRLANWQQEHPNVDTSWEITPVARRDSIFDAESALANANNSNIASTKNLLEYQEDRGIAQVCENLADGLAENEIAVALQQTTTEIQNQTQHIQGGCTFSGCLVYGKNAHLINVGDSAIFGITHDGKAQRLTAIFS